MISLIWKISWPSEANVTSIKYLFMRFLIQIFEKYMKFRMSLETNVTYINSICLENSLIRLLMNWSVWFEKFLDHQKPMLLQSNICLEILDSEFLRNTYKFRFSLETNVTFINSICLENSLIRFLMNWSGLIWKISCP